MDHLKNVSAFPFVNPRKVSVREFIQHWSEALQDETEWTGNCSKHFEQQDAQDLNISLEMVKSLEKDIHPNNFCSSIDEDKLRVEKLTSTIELETLKKLKEHNERWLMNSTYRMFQSQKYRHERLDRPTKTASMLTNKNRPPLAILTVQICKPAVPKPQQKIKLLLDREVQVLSNQPLTALRDAFVCIADILSSTDFSENPDEPLPSFTSHDKMGFFFINNTFYYDSRCENANFSKEIIKWAAERNIGKFTEASMEKTSLEDLTFHLGFPYLYMHANNCEHLLTFTDIQFLAPNVQLTCSYPKYTAVESMQKVKCQMCSLSFSKWIVLNNRRLPETHFYFCHNCFKSFNYDGEGKKRGSFQAYPFLFDLDR